MYGKKKFFFLTVIILSILASTNLIADEISFRCTVKKEYDLTNDGQLVEPDKYYYLNSSFSVERSSGKIIGGVFNNQGDYQKKVIDGYSFKVFSFAEKRGVSESLAIRPNQSGKMAAFVGIDYLQTVVTGTCD